MINNSDYLSDNLFFKSEDDSYLKNNPNISFSSNILAFKMDLDEFSYPFDEKDSIIDKTEENKNCEDITKKFEKVDNKDKNNLSDNKQYKDNKNNTLNEPDKFQKKIIEDSAMTSDKTKTKTNIINSNKSKKKKKSNENKLKEETKKEKNYLGRKRQNNDNILKKVRIMLLNSIFGFVNKKIKNVFKNIGKGIATKQFIKISKKDLNHSDVEYDKQFLNKQLKEIFSENVSEKYTNYLNNKNKELFQELKDLDYFKEIFELKFLDCINHINGTQNELLEGFETKEEIIENENENKNKKFDQNDIILYKEIIGKYINLINAKVSRKSKPRTFV